MYGRQDKGSLQKAFRRFFASPQHFQYVKLAVTHSGTFQILSISHLSHDSVNGQVGPLPGQTVEMNPQRSAALLRPFRQLSVRYGNIQDTSLFRFTYFTDSKRFLSADISKQFIINLQKQFSVFRVQCKLHDISNILYHPMGEKSQFRIADPI